MAYYRVEPFGEMPAHWRTGMVAATIANVNRGRGRRAFKPQDFMPQEPQPKRRQTVADQKKLLMDLVVMTKGRKRERKRRR